MRGVSGPHGGVRRELETTALAGRARDLASRAISIVVPALNEARTCARCCRRCPRSTRSSWSTAARSTTPSRRRARLLPGIVTLTQIRRGKGNALAAGFARVTGDIIVMFDADGSADPAEIPRFVAGAARRRRLRQGLPVPRGRRQRRHHPGAPARQPLPQQLVNRAFRTRFTDLCYGYNAFWADLLPLLDLPDHELAAPGRRPMLWGDGFEIETLINCRFATAGLSITEVPSVERARIHGESNLHAVPDGLRVLRTVRTERGRAPQRGRRRGAARPELHPTGRYGAASGTMSEVAP